MDLSDSRGCSCLIGGCRRFANRVSRGSAPRGSHRSTHCGSEQRCSALCGLGHRSGSSREHALCGLGKDLVAVDLLDLPAIDLLDLVAMGLPA